MSKHSGSGKIGLASHTIRRNRKKPICALPRRLAFESLELRRLLSAIGLNTISNVTLPAGASYLVALNGTDPGQTIQFGATSTDPTQVTPIVMPQTNQSVQFTVNNGSGIAGTMTFQLFDNLTPTTASHIETLVKDGFYNGDYIYRAQNGFVIQGGNDPPQINNGSGINTLPSGVPTTIDEEFNPDLSYTSAGDLAMARTGTPNTSGTEFFDTEAAAESSLNYSYTLFGFQTLGSNIVQEIQAQPTESSSGFSYLDTPIKITSASLITDTQNGVLMLRAPTSATGTYTETVTASDGTNTPATQTFTVTVVPDTSGGVSNPWASQTPATPASTTQGTPTIQFQPQSGQGTSTVTSANNSSGPEKLQFLVTGVTSGDQVTVYANGIAIGSVNAAGNSALVTSDGSTTLLDGTYTITVTQTALNASASWTDSGGSSRTETANVDSLMSTGIQLDVVSKLTVTSTPAATATAGTPYTFQVTTNAPSDDTLTVTPGATLPDGTVPMTFDPTTQTFSWTPSPDEVGTDQTFTYTVTDLAGNSTQLQTVNVAVSAPTLTVTSGALPTTATVAAQYSYQVTTDAASTDTITVAAASGTTLPTGMQITGEAVTWTPTSDQEGTTPSVTLTVTDSTTGATATIGPAFIAVSAASGITVLVPPANVAVGSPVLVAFNDTNTGNLTYTVTTSSSSDPTGSDLTATVMPQSNPVLKVMTNLGEMDFQLLQNGSVSAPLTVAHFESLVDAGDYNANASLPISGTFELEVGSTTTAAITFDSTDLATTAANIESALVTAGFTGATVSATSSTAPYGFQVTFGSSEAPIQYVPDGSGLPVSLTNSVTAAANVQDLTFDEDATFYRILAATDDEGGVGPNGTGNTFPVEANADLRFTSSGLLSTYNNGQVDGNSSEFFITNPDDTTNSNLDFRDTIFGKLIAGENVRQALAATPVQANTELNSEDSLPLTAPIIESMSITTETNAGVFMLSALSGATGPYTVTVSDGLPGGTQTFTIDIGTNPDDPPNPWVQPVSVGANNQGVNTGDQIYTAANTPVTFTPQGESADGSQVQVSVELFRGVPTIPGAFVDSSYTGTNPPAATTNPDMTLTQNGSSYTLTPTNGDYGVQVLEVMGFTPVIGGFSLQVGTTTTGSIDFDSTNMATTAANIQSALSSAGFGASVTVDSTTTAPNFVFDVAFTSSQADITYVAASTALPVSFTNSATAAAADQQLTFTDTGSSWDSTDGIDPVYRAFVPVYVAPPAAQITSISVGGTTVTGSTFANNSSTASELSFNISGAVVGQVLSVYMDGGTTPIATGTVTSPASPTVALGFVTTFTLTTDGTTKIADGIHTFTVSQTAPGLGLYADWSLGTNSSGQAQLQYGAQFNIASDLFTSAASAGTPLTIGLTVVALPVSSAQVGVLYTYVVQTNAPSGDTVTVTPQVLPAGMQLINANTFTWTPTSAQLNTAPEFYATLSDTLGNTGSIGPLNISVIIGLAPTQIPVNSTLGGGVTVLFSGSQVLVFDSIDNAVLSDATFKPTDTIQIDAPAGQANSVMVLLPTSPSAPLPKAVLVEGASGATNNQVLVLGTGAANTFTLAGGTVMADGLATQMANVQSLTLAGFGTKDYFNLNSSTTPTAVVVTGGFNTLDFSQDTGGVNVNLGLDDGQAQSIAPWNTRLAIVGVVNKLIGSQYADVLSGGSAAMTEIISGGGNDTIFGGSGDNILMGGGGSDTIIGGTGRNLLIGGTGNSILFAKGWENLVFGGTTDYDSNDQALLSLLNQGPRGMFGYSARRALASAAANPALLSSLFSFQDSGAHDIIFGGGGSTNWLVPGKNGTVVG